MVCRCPWANKTKLEQDYHDKEWGIPVHDDLKLFEMLILEGKQAGLSWSTILNKRESIKKAFDDLDPNIIIHYDQEKTAALLETPGIIRNRLKIKAVIENARCYFKVRDEFGSFDHFLWQYVQNKPIINTWDDISQVPARTDLSDKISKDMKKIGFKFVGSTIIYAFMQATGIVNDHLLSCDFKSKI